MKPPTYVARRSGDHTEAWEVVALLEGGAEHLILDKLPALEAKWIANDRNAAKCQVPKSAPVLRQSLQVDLFAL